MSEAAYRYDAFISHAAEDRDWARELAKNLAASGFTIFLDERLTPGDDWQGALRAAVKESRNLIVLWSDHARQSAWVARELARFGPLAAKDPQRHLIQVNLQGRNPAYRNTDPVFTGAAPDYTAIDILEEAGVYPGDPASVPPALWKRVIDAIASAMRDDVRADVERPQSQDYAIVIVVKADPFDDDGSATEPMKIAEHLGAWLTAPDGGQIPERNTFALVGGFVDPSAAAADEAFNRAFLPLLDENVNGRRLYIYCAGRGARLDGGSAILLTPPGPSSTRPMALVVRRFADFFRNSGAFSEVVLLADLQWARDPVAGVEYLPEWRSEPTAARDTAHFYVITQPADATGRADERPGAERDWTLSRAVVEGLSGAAADTGGAISSESLAEFLKRRMSPEPETFAGSKPLFFGISSHVEATPAAERERVATQSDDPAMVDALGRRPFAEVLGARIEEVRRTGQARGQLYSTFMINLHGEWGAGKTTLLGLLKKFLQDPKPEVEKPWVVVEFNAWRQQRLQPPWWTLINEVYTQSRSQVRDRGWLLRLRWRSWRARADLLPSLASAALLVVAMWLVLAGVLKRPPALPDADLVLKILGALLAVGAAILTLSRSLVFGSARAAQTYMELRTDPLKPVVGLFNRLVAAVGRPIVIFIDDLDRCDAAYVVQLLEGIQTLFRGAPVTYVVAADRNWISSCFETKYAEFTKTMTAPGRPLGYLFLDKVFQVSIALPKPSAGKRQEYFKALLAATGTTDAKKMEEVQKQAEIKALDEMKNAHTQEELEAKIRAAGASDKVREQAMRAAAARQITTAEALMESEHRLQAFDELLESNPRAMKRFINAVGLRQAANFLEDCSISQGELARWTVIESRWPMLAEFLMRHPHCVTNLSAATPADAFPDELQPLFADDDVRRVVCGEIGRTAPLTEATIERLVGHARVAAAV